MPANKNALVRYKILDEMLANRHRYFTRTELHEKCNEKLIEKGYKPVSKRAIELDLVNMEIEFPEISITHDMIINGKRIVRYEDQSKTIFTNKLSQEETQLLREVLNTLGQFSGLDNFEWLDKLQTRLNLAPKNSEEEVERKLISFSSNPYLSNESGEQVTNLLASLFSSISNKVTVAIEYKPFGKEPGNYIICPYLLKQYRERWYLIGQLATVEYGFLMTLPLDRISSSTERPDLEFRECYCDIDERYEEIIGITYNDQIPLEKINFAISKDKAPYINTKPVHGSQRLLSRADQDAYHALYPALENYLFYQVECRPNNELKEFFYSFDKNIVVLHDGIRKEICTELKRQAELYQSCFQRNK